MASIASRSRPARFLVEGTGLLAFLLLTPQPGFGWQALSPPEFARVNKPGFGDPQNSFSWSMAWFQGNLYVGTNRDFLCVEKATEAYYNVGLYTTRPAPCVTCPSSPYDMDLRAEIWCYSPSSGQWSRVYQSPADLPNPKAPGKFVARDIGYRDMVVFTEPDGTQALYIVGATAGEYIPGLPPPRILRTTDGVTFAPIPQDQGTTLGDLNAVTYRATAVYNNRLYVSASPSMTGDGYVLEAATPALGNNAFRQVTNSSLLVYELNVFNGSLYIGAGDQVKGYSVWKTNATGSVPYALTPVVTGGAGRGSAMASVVSMHVFNNRLYVGAAAWYPTLDLTCEMIRINPDDSWQVVVGDPRLTPSGLQFPISGLPDGFGNPFNAHIWRIADHQGVLYAGTNDDSGGLAGIPVVNLLPALFNEYGFDLFSSGDGRYWTTVTQNAFGSPYDFGCRCLTSTPAGLFLGSTNYAQGTSVWLGRTPGSTAAVAPSSASPLVRSVAPRAPAQVAAPARLSIEPGGTEPVVSWDAAPGASKYRVFRAAYRLETKAGRGRSASAPNPATSPGVATGSQAPAKAKATGGTWVRGPFKPIAMTSQPFYVDHGAAHGARHAYYVEAVDQAGRSSGPSNTAALPYAASGPTFASAEADLRGLFRRRRAGAKPAAAFVKDLGQARESVANGDLQQAGLSLASLHDRLARGRGGVLSPTEVEDMEASLAHLQRRIDLTRAGVLDPASLLRPR